MRLWRPVGLNELRLIYESGLQAFPPRLPDQPIFYPVLNLDYAKEIARKWNTARAPFAGYVTEFEVADALADRYDRQVVGGRQHEELWVPAEGLPQFNAAIDPPIRVVAAYFGEGFEGEVPAEGCLAGKTAPQQLPLLSKLLSEAFQGFEMEITANHAAVFLNFAFWEHSSKEAENRSIIGAIEQTWLSAFPNLPLPKSNV